MTINRSIADLLRSHATIPTAGTPGKNLVINGAMNVSQRGVNAAILAGFDSTTNTYGPDRFLMSGGGTPQNRGEVEHVSSGGPTGFPSFFRYDITTAESAVAAGEYTIMQQRIEGYIANRLSWGNAAAKAATLSFYMRSPKSGTHCVAIGQSGGRYQIKEFTVTSADTWEKFSVTFSADTGGTTAAANTEGMRINWPIICGSTYQASADSWAGATDFATSNQQNLADSTSNNIDLTGVQLEIGSVATDFEHEDYGTTLEKCYRYFQRHGMWTTANPGTGQYVGACYNTSSCVIIIDKFSTMRAIPTMTVTAAQWKASPNNLGAAVAFSGFGFNIAGARSSSILGTGSSGLTAGDTTYIIPLNASSAIDFSAEL